MSAQHGVFYALTDLGDGGEPVLQFQAGYGFKERKHLATYFRLGEGLVGQCALEKERILLTDVPSDYIQISSGLGESTPLNIIVLPILFEGSVRAVIELASFAAFSPTHQSLLDQLTESIGLVLNTVERDLGHREAARAVPVPGARSCSRARSSCTSRTRTSPSRRRCWPTRTTRSRASTRRSRRPSGSSRRRRPSCRSRRATSRSSSRTCRTSCARRSTACSCWPSSSRTTRTATSPTRQVQYAHVIRSSGVDLLKLLNDILDLAKVESNTVHLEISDVSLADLRDSMRADVRARRRGAEHRRSRSSSTTTLPATMATDPHRLRQVLKNLLSNAFKFTESGQVDVRIAISQEAGDRRRRAAHAGLRVVAIERHRHRHRHRGGAPDHDVRGVRPG